MMFLISGPTSLPTPEGVERIEITSAREMEEQVLNNTKDADVIIMAAAVAEAFKPDATVVEAAQQQYNYGCNR